jgi:hypothetical protein
MSWANNAKIVLLPRQPNSTQQLSRPGFGPAAELPEAA